MALPRAVRAGNGIVGAALRRRSRRRCRARVQTRDEDALTTKFQGEFEMRPIRPSSAERTGRSTAAGPLPCRRARPHGRARAHRHRVRARRLRAPTASRGVGGRGGTDKIQIPDDVRNSSRSTGSTWTSGRTARGGTGTGTTGCVRPRTTSTRSSRACGTRTGCARRRSPRRRPSPTTSPATRA